VFTNPSSRFFVAAATLLTAISIQAQVFNESGDAGQTPGTAQNSGLTQSNTVGQTIMILGNISGVNDADVFRLTLTLPAQVQFSTVNSVTSTSGIDTSLFLFSSTGAPIYANNDADGTTLQSRLPGGSSFTMTLSPGTYLIGISLADNEPINTSNQLVFVQGGDSTEVRGPAAGLNPATYSNFNGNASFAESGNYQIDITTTAAVPEPSTVSLIVGAVGLGAIAYRKRTALLRK
jgi:hypothetical protein